MLLSTVILSLSFCSSSDKKDTPQEDTTKKTDTTEPTPSQPDTTKKSFELDPLEEVNKTLAEYRYPDGKKTRGFGYKKADVNKTDFSSWASNNASFIKDALNKLPESYLLQVTGHTDSTGPEEPEGNKKGNLFYAKTRAEAVKDALVKNGIPASRIVTVGVGSSQPVAGEKENDEINRRVTFKVIKQ